MDAEQQIPEAETLEAPATEVTRAQLSRILGCNIRTVSKLEADGIFAPSERGRGGKASVFSLEEVIPKYVNYRVGIKPAEDNSRGRRDRSQAELNELRLAELRGELLPRDLVVAEGAAYVSRVMAKLRALPSRAVQEGSIPPESLPKIEALIEEAVLEMSGWSEAKS